MYRPTYYVIFFLIIIFVYHLFQNNLEKKFNVKYFGYNKIKRPYSDDYMYTIRDYGMPSGHAEIATIFSCILYYYKYISLWLCILLIFIFSAQRVIWDRHSIIQVIMGIICGLIYSYIYISNNLSFLSIFIVFLISLTLILAIIYKIQQGKGKIINSLDENKTTISYLYEIIQ